MQMMMMQSSIITDGAAFPPGAPTRCRRSTCASYTDNWEGLGPLEPVSPPSAAPPAPRLGLAFGADTAVSKPGSSSGAMEQQPVSLRGTGQLPPVAMQSAHRGPMRRRSILSMATYGDQQQQQQLQQYEGGAGAGQGDDDDDGMGVGVRVWQGEACAAAPVATVGRPAPAPAPAAAAAEGRKPTGCGYGAVHDHGRTGGISSSSGGDHLQAYVSGMLLAGGHGQWHAKGDTAAGLGSTPPRLLSGEHSPFRISAASYCSLLDEGEQQQQQEGLANGAGSGMATPSTLSGMQQQQQQLREGSPPAFVHSPMLQRKPSSSNTAGGALQPTLSRGPAVIVRSGQRRSTENVVVMPGGGVVAASPERPGPGRVLTISTRTVVHTAGAGGGGNASDGGGSRSGSVTELPRFARWGDE